MFPRAVIPDVRVIIHGGAEQVLNQKLVTNLSLHIVYLTIIFRHKQNLGLKAFFEKKKKNKDSKS